MTSASPHGAHAHEAVGETPDRRMSAVGHPGVFQDLLPLALWVADAEGRMAQWSLAAHDLLGHTPEQVVGKDVNRVLVPEENRDLAERLTRTVQGAQRSSHGCRSGIGTGIWSIWTCGSARSRTGGGRA